MAAVGRLGWLYATRWPLRNLLGRRWKGGIYGIVLPTYRDGRLRNSGLITSENAEAFADLRDACAMVGSTSTSAVSFNLPGNFPQDQILLGGHIANEQTRENLERYFPSFRWSGSPDDTPCTPSEAAYYYRCGGLDFIDTPDVAWAFVARICPDISLGRETIFLVFGRSSAGTSAAAKIFRYRATLLGAPRGRSFFLAFPVDPQRGAGSAPDDRIDLFGAARLVPEEQLPPAF
jgi:hypothetical protein